MPGTFGMSALPRIASPGMLPWEWPLPHSEMLPTDHYVALVGDTHFASLTARKAYEDALEEVVGAWTRDQDRWQVTAALQSAGIAAFPTFTCQDIVEDPHMNARGYIERLPHPEVGARAHTGIPWRFARRRNGVRFPAPCLGADTEETLREVLGYDEARIAALHRAEVLT